MKRSLIFIALLISSLAYSQQEDGTLASLDLFLSVDQPSTFKSANFTSFLNKLEKKRSGLKNENDFIQYAFTKTHQQYLKRYVEYTSLNALFKEGSYNCLTGTILYTLILNHFQIPHQVIETNYHIFILAETKQGKILIESTDPINGFVVAPVDIEKRINSYRENIVQVTNSKQHYYHFNFDLFNPVSFEELQGLLYYNKSVNAYNQRNLAEAVQYLEKAHKLYSSSRIDEFSQILLLSLRQSTIENQLRKEYIKTVLAIRQDLPLVVASLN